MALPKYPYPFDGDIDFRDFTPRVRVYNTELQREVVRRLRQFLKEEGKEDALDHILIATLGSDARLEKGPKSTMELIVYHEGNYRDVYPLVEALKEFTAEREEKEGRKLFSEIEVKDITLDLMSWYHNIEGRIFPGRVVEGKPLLGREDLFDDAVRKVCAEFSTMKTKKSFFESLKAQKRRARNRMLTGSNMIHGDIAVHYDLDEGQAYYDGKTRGSFKYGPVRFVQAVLLLDLFRYARAFPKKGPGFLAQMPSNIADRLAYFETNRVVQLTPDELRDVANCYQYFLLKYHQSQARYNQSRALSVTPFDKTEVRERIDTLKGILQRPVIKTDHSE